MQGVFIVIFVVVVVVAAVWSFFSDRHRQRDLEHAAELRALQERVAQYEDDDPSPGH